MNESFISFEWICFLLLLLLCRKLIIQNESSLIWCYYDDDELEKAFKCHQRELKEYDILNFSTFHSVWYSLNIKLIILWFTLSSKSLLNSWTRSELLNWIIIIFHHHHQINIRIFYDQLYEFEFSSIKWLTQWNERRMLHDDEGFMIINN